MSEEDKRFYVAKLMRKLVDDIDDAILVSYEMEVEYETVTHKVTVKVKR